MLFPILLAEDDRKIANVVKVYLEEAGYRVLHFEKGKELLQTAMTERPLAVILDLGLPDTTGEELCQEIKELGDIPVIMLTSKASEEERIAGFALGADDYVTKPFSPRELVWRVKALLKRTGREEISGTAPLAFNDGQLLLDGQSYRVTFRGEQLNLTPTEFKVLFTLSSAPQKVFSREELVEKALGYQFEGYERSIDAHIKNIRQKLAEDPKNPTYIHTIYGVGYRFSGKRDA
jgi:two-component system OmpR family response regulator